MWKYMYKCLIAVLIVTLVVPYNLEAYALETTYTYNFSSGTVGKTPEYVEGDAVITSGKSLDASENKSALFDMPANSDARITARICSDDMFTLRLYDGAGYETFRIEPQNSNEILTVDMTECNLSVICGSVQITQRKTSVLKTITAVEFCGAIIDDVCLGEQAIAPRIINPNIYIYNNKLNVGYIFYAPDGEKEQDFELSFSWFKKEQLSDAYSTSLGKSLSIEIPENINDYVMCKITIEGESFITPWNRVCDSDVLVFDYKTSTSYRDGKQAGITFKTISSTASSGWQTTPIITDWSEYDELIIRGVSNAATGRIYQLNIDSGTDNGYYFTFFRADWGDNRLKDVILPIGEAASLHSAGSGVSWSNILGSQVGTMLSTTQKETGSLTEEETDSGITFNEIFLRKKNLTQAFYDTEFIPNAEKRSIDTYDYAKSIINNEHPKILLTEKKITELKTHIQTDEYIKKSFEQLKKDVNTSISNGALIKCNSSNVEELTKAALLYNLSPDNETKEWIWESLENICINEASSLNPESSSYLSFGDGSRAIGMTYDWMYNHWSDEERLLVRNSIMRCSINPVLPILRSGVRWAGAGYGNWNQVILSGIGTAALAICDTDNYSDICNEVLDRVTFGLHYGMRDIENNGAHKEGVAYWHYVMSTFLPFEKALFDICGTNDGLMDGLNMENTGCYALMMSGPQGLFSFADVIYPGNIRTGAFYRLSEYFDNPLFGAYQYEKSKDIGGDYISMLLYDVSGYGEYMDKLPRYKYFDGDTESFVMRGGETIMDAYLGFKGGRNGISHSQYDIGTFVYDIDNVRWFCDLGRDSYGDYNNKYRYYRNRAEGNNCIVINPDNDSDQNPDAYAPVCEYSVGDKGGYGIIDMSEAYDEPETVLRGYALLDDFETLVIQDEITSDVALEEVYSFLHSEQEITVSEDGKSAIMTPADGRNRKLFVKLLSDCDAALFVTEAELMNLTPPSDQYNNASYKKLAVKAENVTNATFTVVISKTENASYDTIKPLAIWNNVFELGSTLEVFSDADIEIPSVGENTYSLSAKMLDGTVLNNDVIFELTEPHRGITLSNNILKVASDAIALALNVSAASGNMSGVNTLNLSKDYILVDGVEYNDNSSVLTTGKHTVISCYADSSKSDDVRLYLAHFSGDCLKQVVMVDEKSESLDLSAVLSSDFIEGDYIKSFVLDTYLVPDREAKSVR